MRSNKLNLFLHKTKQGSTLLLVVIMAAVVALLGTAATVAAVSANSVSVNSSNSQQAYFTARSAANATAKYITNPANAAALSTFLPSPGNSVDCGLKQADKLGYYDVTISMNSTADKISVKATGYYPNKTNGQASTATCTITSGSSGSGGTDNNNPDSGNYIGSNNVGGLNIFNNLFYVNSSATIHQSFITGDIALNGSMSIGDSSTFTGKIIASGSVSYLTDGGNDCTASEIDAGGAVSLTGSDVVSGDVNAAGSVSLTGGVNVQGNVNAGGAATIDSSTIGRNVTTGGPLAVSSSTITGTTKQNQSPSPVNIVTPATVSNSVIIPSLSSDKDLYAPVTFSSTSGSQPYSFATINKDGTFDISNYSFSYGATITVNTSSNDINLLINNSQSFSGISIVVSGSHNLNIYLADSASYFNLVTDCYIGSSSYSDNPHVYIFGSKQSISMTYTTSLNACIYMPGGSFSATGWIFNDDYKFRGSMAVNSINLDGGLKYEYLLPNNLSSSPLASLFSTGWSVSSWS